MDVIVTQNINRLRRFRVNDADDAQGAVRKITDLKEGDTLPDGVTRESDGEAENASYSTQAAPKRPANPGA